MALPIVDSDERKGTISVIIDETDRISQLLGAVSINEQIFSVQGPLGVPAVVQKYGLVVCVARGIGAAQMLPICRALKRTGNKIIGILGAKTKRSLMLESQMRIVCDEIYITTNDGSYERRGLASEFLRSLLDKQSVDCVYAAGSVDMMQAASQLTNEKAIPIFVSLSPVVLDAIGLSGACRVRVGGKICLAGIDGPHFDGHSVDFDYLKIRMNAYKENDSWGSRTHPNSPKSDESGIFPKFLSGILNR
ncbi:MAG: sulfide/dihydroorotate dehydrogenase-like FAD/NAD-binding protein [Candidatus Omnitrophica bacterium]|nr:sulfide/dihydroorotate dehydrogenase-like FAD/NAD-binding protein [Candidatus Omnitrophota bacterium]